MDFVVRDLEKYKRAAQRAQALKMYQYLEPLEHIVVELERIVRIDDDLMKGDVVKSLFE